MLRLNDQERDELLSKMKERLEPLFDDVNHDDAIMAMLVGAVKYSQAVWECSVDEALDGLIEALVMLRTIDPDIQGHA